MDLLCFYWTTDRQTKFQVNAEYEEAGAFRCDWKSTDLAEHSKQL